MNLSNRLEHAACLVAGILATVATSRVSGWWLDSGRGVATMLGSLLLLAALAAIWHHDDQRARVIALWIGAYAATAVMLFVEGPGTIWPVVLVVGAVLTGGAVLAGYAVGWALGSWRSTKWR